MKSEWCGKDVEMTRMGEAHSYKFCTECNEQCEGIVESFEEILERKRDHTLPEYVKRGSYWVVVYECRYDVVHVSPMRDGVFAFGQDALWLGSAITEWIKEVEMPKYKDDESS